MTYAPIKSAEALGTSNVFFASPNSCSVTGLNKWDFLETLRDSLADIIFSWFVDIGTFELEKIKGFEEV